MLHVFESSNSLQLSISALAGSDYITVSYDIIFDYNTDTTQCLYVPVVNDYDCVEGNETFYVNFYTSMDCVHVRNDSLPISIVDDDSKCHRVCLFYMWRLSYDVNLATHRV